jgi:hypothetical protein
MRTPLSIAAVVAVIVSDALATRSPRRGVVDSPATVAGRVYPVAAAVLT